MSATTTDITFYVAPDSFNAADKAYNDIPAALTAYADELDAALTERYPDARITVEVAHGTTSPQPETAIVRIVCERGEVPEGGVAIAIG
jgi:hypothetical protein